MVGGSARILVFAFALLAPAVSQPGLAHQDDPVVDIATRAAEEATCTALPDDASSNEDAGATAGEAMPVGEESWSGCFGLGDHEDWYRYEVPEGRIVQATLFPGTDSQSLLLALLECNVGRFLDWHWTDGEPVFATAAAMGRPLDLCVMVYGHPSFDDPFGAYRVRLDLDAHRCISDEEDPQLLLETWVVGCVDHFDALDTFSTSVVAGERITVNLIAHEIDAFFDMNVCEVMTGRVVVSSNVGTDIERSLFTWTCPHPVISLVPEHDGTLVVEVQAQPAGGNYTLIFRRGPVADLAVTAIREIRDPIRTEVVDVPNFVNEQRRFQVEITNVGSARMGWILAGTNLAKAECESHTYGDVFGSCAAHPISGGFVGRFQPSLEPGESFTFTRHWDTTTRLGDYQLLVRMWSLEGEAEASLANNWVTYRTFVRVSSLP